jgi:hypothetical protein
MDNLLKEAVWKQFGASIDMLENAITLCPIEFWDTDKKFWYNAYHCLFYLDYYLTLEPEKFSPPHYNHIKTVSAGKIFIDPELRITRRKNILHFSV